MMNVLYGILPMKSYNSYCELVTQQSNVILISKHQNGTMTKEWGYKYIFMDVFLYIYKNLTSVSPHSLNKYYSIKYNSDVHSQISVLNRIYMAQVT